MDEISYKRELNHSYLVIPCEKGDISGDYAYRMMTGNRIGRLLACSQRQMDGQSFLYYDISSRQPLGRLYESRKLGVRDLSRIVHAVAAMQEDLGEYLLDEQGLLLGADTIFADVETEEFYFCFYPAGKSREGRYAGLADFFLEHVDHGQEHAVNAAYQFYKMSKSDFFVLSSFLPFLDKELTEEKKLEDGQQPLFSSSVPAAAGGFPPPGREESQREEQDSGPGPQREDTDRGGQGFWLFRLFRRKRRREEPPGETAGTWQRFPAETVWDSYVGQIETAGDGETVYFTDLDVPPGSPAGVPCLFGEDGKPRFLLEALPMTVGKLKGKVSIRLQDGSVSRIHARLEAAADGVLVTDFNSKNGTLVNGKKLSPNESAVLREGDRIQFGRERFRYGFLDSKATK